MKWWWTLTNGHTPHFQVSDFIGTFQQQEDEKYELQLLKFFPELNQVVGKKKILVIFMWNKHLYCVMLAFVTHFIHHEERYSAFTVSSVSVF